MADHYSPCIIGVMDRLWFHQIVLFSEPTASIAPKPIETTLPISESMSYPSLPPPPDVEKTSDEPPSPVKQVLSESFSLPLQVWSNSNATLNTLSMLCSLLERPMTMLLLFVFTSYCHKDELNKEEENQEIPKKVLFLADRVRSHSSSALTSNHRRKFRKLATARRLQKSMSYRTLGELELEEVKGFMDLGFIFRKENMSPRMMSVVPGLQRLSRHQNKQNLEIDVTKIVGEGDIEKKEEKRNISIMRPYLSEAWLIKRPDSQLLNLKIPRLCSAADMKKHLLFWAKTVASEIHQE